MSSRAKSGKPIGRSPAKAQKSKHVSIEHDAATLDSGDANNPYSAPDAMFTRQVLPPKEQLKLSQDQLDVEVVKRLQALDPYLPKAAVRFSATERAFKAEPVASQLLVLHSQHGYLQHYVAPPILQETGNGKDKGMRGRSSVMLSSQERASVLDATAAPCIPPASSTESKRLRNRFNFMDTGSQTVLYLPRSRGTVTDPVPREDFGATCTRWDLREAYEGTHAEGRPRGTARADSIVAQENRPDDENMPPGKSLARGGTLLERLVTHNSQHDLLMDFKYFDDAADSFQEPQGTLLPLWEFKDPAVKHKAVTAIVWSKHHPDLLAAGYGSFEFQRQLHGLILCWSLKQPARPQSSVTTQSGVMCLDFHHAMPNLLLCGCYDGGVAIYDISQPAGVLLCQSNTLTWQHADPVWAVSWRIGETPKTLAFVSVSSDGHVTSWRVEKANLHHQHIMELTAEGSSLGSEGMDDELLSSMLQSGSCMAFNKVFEQIYLVGTLEGTISKCSEAYTSEALVEYKGHTGAVYAVQWNPHHSGVFLSASSDWTVKVWDSNQQEALLTLDLGSPVGDAAWCPQGATVFAAAAESGQVSVFNLRRHQALPVCQQKVAPRGTRLTKLVFNWHYPLLVVGTDGGHIRCLKLSPNLRPGPTVKTQVAAAEAAKAAPSGRAKPPSKSAAASESTNEAAAPTAAAPVDLIAAERAALDSILTIAARARV